MPESRQTPASGWAEHENGDLVHRRVTPVTDDAGNVIRHDIAETRYVKGEDGSHRAVRPPEPCVRRPPPVPARAVPGRSDGEGA